MTEGHTYLRTHDLSAEHMLINLQDARNELLKLPGADLNRQGITLIKQGGLSLVLTRLSAGASLEEHAAPKAVTVQVLEGRVLVHVGDQVVEAEPGDLVAFDEQVRHSVEAVENSTFLITLAMPS